MSRSSRNDVSGVEEEAPGCSTQGSEIRVEVLGIRVRDVGFGD